jgi:spore germination protein YaaH
MIRKKIIILIGTILILIAILVVAIQLIPTDKAVVINQTSSGNKEVQGFYSLKAEKSDWKNLRFDLLSTLVLYFINPTMDGDINMDDSDIPKDLVALAHKNNVKVVVSIQTSDGSITDAILTTSKDKFLDNILYFVQRNNLDGVDIDIEDISVTNSITKDRNKQLMTSFMRDLSTKLWGSNPDYRISIDVNGNYHGVDKIFDLAVIQNFVNYLMIMGYDYHYSDGPTAGSVAPIDSYNNEPSIRNSLSYYSNISNKNKLLLGVPYYGYEWNTKSGKIESSTLSDSTYYSYQEMNDRVGRYGRIWDDTWKTPWYKYQSGGLWYQGHYDDIESLGIKYDLVNSANIAGIGIWQLGYASDNAELWQLIQNKFEKI